ncbi:MAG: DUF4446 family protein [Lachnospiraceae bacterium]|nr:DUF4446 family protein [Lachnospiraceae bacterium]
MMINANMTTNAGSFTIGNTVLLALFLLLAVAVVVLLILAFRQGQEIKTLKFRLNRFMNGRDAESLENEIAFLVKDHNSLKQVVELSKKDIEVLFHHMRSAYQKYGLVKYDAFQQMGGQLSFCLVLLDQDNNGFILNSVHSTEGAYCYSKEIRNGVGDIDLGKEEKEALAIAMGEDK